MRTSFRFHCDGQPRAPDGVAVAAMAVLGLVAGLWLLFAAVDAVTPVLGQQLARFGAGGD